MTRKFFIALLPPDSILNEVREIQLDLCDRYGIKASLKTPPHITLMPPIEMSMDLLEPLQMELAKFAKLRSSFGITLSGFAAFPPRVIYVDVAPNPILQNLYIDITSTLANKFGIVDPYASRPFVPHMTVGFRDFTPEIFDLIWSEFSDRQIYLEFKAIDMTLLEYEEQKWNISTKFEFQ
jgi:2'-5' RNA ligase